MTNPNNPPAFARTSDGGGGSRQDGMSLRDYFAAKAMQAFLDGAGPKDGHWDVEAKGAYEVADAMLAARGR